MDKQKALDKLEKVKLQLENAKKNKQRLEGKREVKMENLNNLGYKSLKSATKAIDNFAKQLDILDSQLEALLLEFAKEFPELIDEEEDE